MKKLLSILLALAMVLSFAACGNNSAAVPGEDLKTLNEIFKAGYEANGTMAYDYLFVQTVANKKGNEYVVTVKVPEELRETFQSIDFGADDAQKQYLDLLGDMELTDVLDTATVLPDNATCIGYIIVIFFISNCCALFANAWNISSLFQLVIFIN